MDGLELEVSEGRVGGAEGQLHGPPQNTLEDAGGTWGHIPEARWGVGTRPSPEETNGYFLQGLRTLLPSRWTPGDLQSGSHRTASPTLHAESGLARGIYYNTILSFPENPWAVTTGSKRFGFQNLITESESTAAEPQRWPSPAPSLTQPLHSTAGARGDRRPTQDHSCSQKDKRRLSFHLNMESLTPGLLGSGTSQKGEETRGAVMGEGEQPLGDQLCADCRKEVRAARMADGTREARNQIAERSLQSLSVSN